MHLHNAPDAPPAPFHHRTPRHRGFTLAETLVAMALCAVAFGVFHAGLSQGMKVVKDAREEVAASQLLEERLDALRAAPLWTNLITPTGLTAALTLDSPAAQQLLSATETFTVSPYPGDTAAFTVMRDPMGKVSAQGNPLPLSQGSVRISGLLTWGGSAKFRRTRSVSKIFTRGGL